MGDPSRCLPCPGFKPFGTQAGGYSVSFTDFRDLGLERLSHFFNVTQSFRCRAGIQGGAPPLQDLRVCRYLVLLSFLDKYCGHCSSRLV